MNTPPAIIEEAPFTAVAWSFQVTDAPRVFVDAKIRHCRLVARRTKCRWTFSAKMVYSHEMIAAAHGSVTEGPGGSVRWSYDTGARRRGLVD